MRPKEEPTLGTILARRYIGILGAAEELAACIPEVLSQWVLTALEPAALTLSLEATSRLEQERQAVDRLWPPRVERTAYESERAAGHDRMVEPQHRVVARQLTQECEAKPTARRHPQEEYEPLVRAQPRSL